MNDPTPQPRPTAKDRAKRIPLGYVHTHSWMDRTKRGLGILALAATLSWMGCSLVGLQSREIYSRGSLADAHAMWDQKCDACHVGFHPVRDGTVAQLFGANSHQTDHLCQTCHEGPLHHASQLASSVQSCGTCHQDHRGRDASLVQMNDAQCTSCHAQLEAHVQPGTGLQFASHITSFAYPDGHPEFRALSTPDPGWLKFTHAQHLLPGMPRVPGEEGWFRLDQIDPAEREAFRRPGQGDRDLVELDCRACHTLDPHDDSLGLADRQVSGDYFLPVRYKQHCRACHPLSIDPVRSNESLAAAPREEPLDTTLQAPHGLQPSALREWLDLQWLAEWVAADGMILSDPLPADRHPALTQPALPATFAEAQQRDVDQSLSLLLQHAKACGKCHYFERQGQPRAILSASDVGRDNSSWRVIPPAAPRVWLDHARFNHRSHRAVHCRECHAQAFPDTSTAARWDAAAEGKLVMLPGIDTCRQCHAPAHSSWSTTTGGARHDCTECHLYHHGDFPRRGPGDPARAANLPRSIHELLQVHPPVIPATDVQP